MADPYEDRDRGEDWRRDSGYRREFTREERGPFQRAGDEVRSWFGDEEAERRRRMDEARHGRGREQYGREPDRNPNYRPAPRREWHDRGAYARDWDYGHRMGFDYDSGPRGAEAERFGPGERSTTSPPYDYGRTSASRDWNEPAYYRSAYTALGPHSYGATSSEMHGHDTARSSQGWFAGLGPRGYQRSDERIREDVCDRLTDDPWLDPSDIEVAVRAGEVTLSGNVRDRSDKRRIEDVIEAVSGVREVHNNLRVGANREQGITPATTTGATTSRR